MSSIEGRSASPVVPALCVRTADGRTFRFSRTFHIGRERDCEVRIEDVQVSRKHLVVLFGNGRWEIRDLQSSNGMFLEGQRTTAVSVDEGVTVRLGADGPLVAFEVERPASVTNRGVMPAQSSTGAGGETRIIADYAERYFGSRGSQEEVGGRTRMIRKAFQDVQKKQRRKYGWVVAVAALAAVVSGGYAYYGHRQISRQRAVAEELFYAMKSLDVDMANMEQLVAASGNAQSQDLLKQYVERRRQMESTYDRFLAGSNVYDRSLTEQERLILRVTRAFGECEVAAPQEYLTEVSSYIRKWQGSGRFARAVTLGQQMGYTKTIAQEFVRQNLPPQFVYLALQESDFDPFTSGPPTSFGIAKGMWQFIPETGARYGLTIGPLANVRKPDPADDRHNWQKATASGDALYQGHLLDRCASVWTARDGVVQLGRAAGHQPPAEYARQPEGPELLEGAREISRPVAEGNVRLRVLYCVGRRDRRKPSTLRLFVRQPARSRRSDWSKPAVACATCSPHEGHMLLCLAEVPPDDNLPLLGGCDLLRCRRRRHLRQPRRDYLSFASPIKLMAMLCQMFV